jgi:hypothetical protein
MDDLVLSNIFNAIPLLLVSVFAYSMWYLWMTPMNRVRTLDDNVGYAHVEKWSSTSKRKAAINRLRKTRKAGQIPPPFPNSWHVIAESRDVSSKYTAMVQGVVYINTWDSFFVFSPPIARTDIYGRIPSFSTTLNSYLYDEVGF